MKRREFIDSIKTEFTKDNIQELTGISWEEWCEFSGLFAVGIPKDIVRKDEFIFSGFYPDLKMSAINNATRAEFTFYLESNIIRINYFYVREKHKGIGKKAFNNFLKLALSADFKLLRCRAKGGKGIEGFNGHVTWGKFGFTMNKEFHSLFLDKMKSEERPEKCLQELLRTEAGCHYWANEGNSWEAEFSLSPHSANQRIWRIYSTRLKFNQYH